MKNTYIHVQNGFRINDPSTWEAEYSKGQVDWLKHQLHV